MSFKTPTEDNLRTAAKDDARVERVRKAVTIFETMIRNHFEPLCQVMTKKRSLRVRPHPTSSFTDGKMICLRVPLELGGDTEHIKELCGERNEDLAMKCPACYVLDDALANAAHEVAHITGLSFAEIDDKTKDEMFEKLLRPRIEAIDPTKVEGVRFGVMRSKSAMEIANKVDLWLPMMVNALEDVFVNERMYEERPGFRASIVGTTVQTLTDGLLGVDGVKHNWADAPLPARAIMTCYAMAAGLDKVIPYLGTDLDEVIADDELRKIVTQVHGRTTAQERLKLALEALEHLRTHGLCVDDRSLVFETVCMPGAPSDEKAEKGDGSSDDDECEDGGGSGATLIESDDDEEKTSGAKGSSKDEAEDADDDSKDDDEDDSGAASKDDESEDEEADDTDDASAGGDDADDEDEDEDDDADDSEAAGKGDDSDDEDDDLDADEADGGDDDLGDDDDDFGDDFSDDDDDNSYAPDEASTGIPEGSHKEVEMEAEEAAKVLEDFMGHGEKEDHGDELDKDEFEAEVDTQLAEMIIEQKDLFDDLSFNVRKVQTIEPRFFEHDQLQIEAGKAPTNSDIAPVQGHLRVMFTENRKLRTKRNLTNGPLLDTAHLTRAMTGDSRLYAKRSIPAKRDWAVTIGLDCSGSTGYGTSSVIKNGGYAMAELLSSLGIPFSMYGHTGRHMDGSRLKLELFHVKNFEEGWNDAAKQRCLQLRGSQANLDGHTLEFYRRDIQARRSTDKLIMYFTDGEMPAENYDEELALLQKNIKVCTHRRIKLVGVGVGTDSPKRHGLDTIRYDSIKDLPKLITELGKRLSE